VGRSSPGFFLLAIAALGASGCRGKDISFDCEVQHERFIAAAEAEERPLVPIPQSGPNPVGIQISEAALNELLASVVADIPFAGAVPFGVLPQGPSEASFMPKGAPTVVLDAVPGCDNCVLIHLDFTIGLATTEGEPLSAGPGFADIAVPIVLETDETTGTSTLYADYSTAEIYDWFFSVFGFASDQHASVAGALQILMTEELQANPPKKLFSVGSWEIGNDQVRLIARDVTIHPDADKLVLGMQTNLDLPAAIQLDLTQPLPMGTEMLVSMDPVVLLAMMHRMLAEGEIPRTYDENGDPDAAGIYGVTIDNITPSGDGSRLIVRFKVWRTDEGYCGYAVAEMPLLLDVDMAFSQVTITPGDATVIEGQGIGAAAAEEDELVESNQELVQEFRASLADQVGNTFNYDELDLEGSHILFNTVGVLANTSSLETFLEITVLAEE
jgi:hypothetical protein